MPTLFKLHAGFKAHAGALMAVALLAGMSADANAQRAGGPFARLGGSWSGSGTITTSNGARERIRCVATYAVGEGGSALSQNLRCASDSYKFYVSSDVHDQGGRISGTWSETTRGATGSLSGHAEDSHIAAVVSGVGFSANLSLSLRGNSQFVTIRPNGGSDIVDVSVSLHRG